MNLTHIVSFSAIFAALMTAPFPAAMAQAQDGTVHRAAEIRVGSCDAPGDVVAPLVPLSAPAGDVQGQTDAMPVEQSATQVPIPIENLLGKDHVVIAHTAPEEIFAPVSCGPIGGAFNDQGALVVSLDAMNGSRINGVAYLLPMPDTASTVVTLMLTPRNGSEPISTDPHDPNVPDVVVVDNPDGEDAPGSTGKDGADAAGNNGADGADGVDGVDGSDGAGATGTDGTDGADGVAGADGQDGQPGQPGEPGTGGTGGDGVAGSDGGDGGNGGDGGDSAGGVGGDGGAGGAGADATVQTTG